MTAAEARNRMVEDQLIARGIDDPNVLAAMRKVPRHLFVPAALSEEAYADQPLPIGGGQTISQPFIVALMSQALGLHAGEKVLEIGTGSGYQAAVLAEMGLEVYTIERLPELANSARAVLASLGYSRVHVREGDGNDGWKEMAPFDGIVITAAAREIPRAPLSQLREGGRMVLPIGDDDKQELVVVSRKADGYREEYLGGCRFVHLIGRHGWNV